MPRFYVYKKKWMRCLARFFDGVGLGLTFFWIKKNCQFDPKKTKKILFVRMDHLGDALLLRPALLQFRNACPECEMHLLTPPENAPLFEVDPFIDKVIPYSGHWLQKSCSKLNQICSFFKILNKLKQEKYDTCVDFRGDVRVAALLFLAHIPIRLGYGATGGGWMLTHEKELNLSLHQVLLNIKLLDAWIPTSSSAPNPKVHYSESTVLNFQKHFPNLVFPFAVIHAGAGNAAKEWPVENFKNLARQLLQNGQINAAYWIGTESEKFRAPLVEELGVFDLRGKTDLHELAFLLRRAAFFVGNDSGPAHLAAAQGISVALIASGTNNITVWHPWTKKLVVVPSHAREPASTEVVELAIQSLMREKR